MSFITAVSGMEKEDLEKCKKAISKWIEEWELKKSDPE